MRRFFCYFTLVLTLLSAGNARAFSLLGPFKEWQVGEIGYQLVGDIGGPMNLGEEYRWNIPIITYAFDHTFFDYFGWKGTQAVSSAFQILNGALTNLAATDPNAFPQTGMLRRNYQATALGLIDLKSQTLEIMMEQLGLADPVRFAYTLRSRDPDAADNLTNYTVIRLNFDPLTWSPTPYVNGTLLGYRVEEPLEPGDYADALEVALDPVPVGSEGNPSPVAHQGFQTRVRFRFPKQGTFWMGLTRDDIGGLKYIYRFNNFNVEQLLPDILGTVIRVTNRNSQVLLNSFDLRNFIAATTNSPADPATLLTIFPGLAITQTNITFALTNNGTTLTLVPRYSYQFTNVFTNLNTAPPSVFIVPTNVIGFECLNQVLLTNRVTITNLVTVATEFRDANNPVLVQTIDLLTFRDQARTNPPADLLALYPGLLITSTNVSFSTGFATNFVFALTNPPPWFPAGSPPMLVPIPIVTAFVQTNYSYTFGNLVTNNLFFETQVIFRTETLEAVPWTPAGGPLITNVVDEAFTTNILNGDIFILPTNVVRLELQRPALITNVVAVTNFLNPAFLGTNILATNAVIDPNVFPTNFLNPLTFQVAFTNQSFITFSTNYIFSAIPTFAPGGFATQVVVQATNFIIGACQIVEQLQSITNTAGLKPGVNSLLFTNVAFDSIIGQGFVRVTNRFTNFMVTNGQAIAEVVDRVVQRPDVLLLAGDNGVDVDGFPFMWQRTTTDSWINNGSLNTSTNVFGEQPGGPGVIPPQIQIQFSNLLPYFRNTLSETASFIDQDTALVSWAWGAYDGSTNAPVVFPDFFSIHDIESVVLSSGGLAPSAAPPPEE